MYETMRDENLEAAHRDLFTASVPIEPKDIEQWVTTWFNSFEIRVSLGFSAQELIGSGRILARIAESYSLRPTVDRLFIGLEKLIHELDPSELQMVEILVDIGELDRRMGRTTSAVDRFNQASEIAEKSDTPAGHKLLSRIFYEFAYLDLYAGDAEAAIRRLALSELEADRAGDAVGAGIARALTATAQIEEGVLAGTLEKLQAEAANFAALAESPAVVAAKRHVFANRWSMNCEMHIIQALLASSDMATARREIDRIANHPNPSIVARSSLDLIDAFTALSEGDLARAHQAADECGRRTPSPKEKQEAYATLLSLEGAVDLMSGRLEAARSQFLAAMDLDPLLRNARGQGWAALGLAILVGESGRTEAALSVLDTGIARCARCCAPIRRALEAFRAELTGATEARHDWKSVLVGLMGPLPGWLRAEPSAA